MLQEILPGLYCIKVVLPNSPLKTLNSYVFMGKERNLLVDTGFNQPQCLDSLQQGMFELNLNMDKTDILLTHCHADHSGLVCKIASPHSRIYMSAIDHQITTDFIEQEQLYWNQLEAAYVREGFPRSEMDVAGTVNPARKFAADKSFASIAIAHNEIIAAGDRQLKCIFTPGHTPGHMCFYSAEEKLMLTGDHILFDITPNITVWRDLPNALAHYLDSLHKISVYDVAIALPGHRENSGLFQQRIQELLAHHQARLNDALQIIAQGGSMHAYDVASKMHWDIRAKDWADFPLAQKRFAVGEAIAHIVYLLAQGRIRQTVCDNINYYSPV